MFKKTFIFCLLILLCFLNLYSQYNNKISSYSPPWTSATGNIYPKSFSYNPGSIGYGYFSNSIGKAQFCKFNVGNPGGLTLIGTALDSMFQNGDYANPTGVWKFYVQSFRTPYWIYEVDTSNGTLNPVFYPTNYKSGHRPIFISWDHTTNTMYLVSRNNVLGEIQLYSLDWQTHLLSWIGPTSTQPQDVRTGAFNVNGTLFCIDDNLDALWRVNKFTGVWTEVGPLGHYANSSQAAAFDRSNFSKMLWCCWGDTTGLYEVDTATGSSTMIGPFSSIAYYGFETIGFVPYYGPQIIHTPLQSTTNLTGPYEVSAIITSPGSTITSTKLYWSRNNTVITDSIAMTNTNGNNWASSIPGNGQIATYRYYLRTIDAIGRTAVAPFNAPSNLYTFDAVAIDTIKPIITHTPLQDINILLWPDAVNASVIDNAGIDSVWVRWRINSTSEKLFKLSNISGNNYSSLFNSSYSDVAAGDTIYYRIIAQDNSLNHNKDSTNIWSFVITTDTIYNCIGNGNITISSSPFHTSAKGYKSQMLYTADEIYYNGGVQGDITKIAFFFLRADTSITLKRFNIKMQNTSISALNNGFINNSWYLVYSGNYRVQSTGWQYVNLMTPFHWDGVSNILIEVCFGNDNYTNYSSTFVEGTDATQMYIFGHRNDTLACVQNPDNILTNNAKPNICFRINPTVGLKPGSSNNPTEYKLYQNYPNPFNPVTRIKYDIPKQGYASLRIFDVLGREVKTLVSEIKTAGSYSLDYDASGLPSGIYFYRLECDGYAETKKMLILK